MSKYFVAVLLVVTASQVGMAAAESSLKIGVVSFQQALNDVEQGKTAKSTLKSEFDAKQKKLDLQQEELKKLRDDLDRQKLVSADKVSQQKEQDFNKKFMDLQKNFADYRQEIAEREAAYTAAILKNLREICQEIGKKEGYTLIVENSQDAVLYAGSKDDLTGRVIKLYNQRYKGLPSIKK